MTKINSDIRYITKAKEVPTPKKKSKQKDWIKIGTMTKRFANIYGKKNSQNVIWIDNWVTGNYALVKGKEYLVKKGIVKYKEIETIGNFGTREEAKQEAKKYMEQY